jgi:predicted  nucleic acid-binding Zn-ribbon protein
MNENEQNIHTVTETRHGHSVWLPVLGAAVVLLGGAGIYQMSQTGDLRQKFAAAQQDNASLRTQLSDTDTELRKALDTVQNEVTQSREETTASLQKTQSLASRHADVAVSKIAKAQEEHNKEIADQLDQVKTSSLEASTKLDGKIDGVSNDVGSVKTDVASAKTDIQDTKSELQRARGDMGMMSGLIATNSKEIQALRDLGDRNIFEFTVSKNGTLEKVGDIQVMLRKVDVKRNRYTVDVLADDKRVEKKDRTTNEPVQFYVSKAPRQPYELVVNTVSKDKISGYLATPKVVVSRNEATQ